MRKWVIILIIVALVGGTGWFFYSKSKNGGSSATTTGFKSFFPFGPSSSTTNPTGAVQGGTDQSVATVPPTASKSPFKQLTSHTVAGYTIFTSPNTITVPASTPKGKPTIQKTTDHVLRYVSRTSGFVYEILNGGTPTQVSNIYIPNIYEAFFADSGKTAGLRFLRDDLKTIATYLVPVPDKNPDGTRTQKGGIFLPDGVANIAPSLDGSILARLTFESGSAVLSSTTTTNTIRKELLRSPFHEWLISWDAQKNIYLQTKASGIAPGFLYQVDTVNHRLTRLLGDIYGLTTSVSPNGTYILYSESKNNGFVAKMLTVKTGAVRTIGNSILPEKCAWLKNEDLICAGGGEAPNAVYPDNWYDGTIAFSDKIIHIYTGVNVFDVLYTPNGTDNFDMTNLQVDEDSNILYFINKQTATLWQFTL